LMEEILRTGEAGTRSCFLISLEQESGWFELRYLSGRRSALMAGRFLSRHQS
jgi:hypothetical protein